MAFPRAAVACALLLACASASQVLRGPAKAVDVYALRNEVLASQIVKDKIAAECKTHHTENCESKVGNTIFCQLLTDSHPDLAAEHCASSAKVAAAPQKEQEAAPQPPPQPAAAEPVAEPAAKESSASAPTPKGAFAALKAQITSTTAFQSQVSGLATMMGCNFVKKADNCDNYVQDAAFCLAFAGRLADFQPMAGYKEEDKYCKNIDQKLPALAMMQQGHTPAFVQLSSQTARGRKAPEDDLAKEMTHDLEMNFNKIAPFGKEDTAKELQDHAAKTQDTLVDAVENAEVAEIKRAVFRALTRLRAATIKEFDTIARLETQAIDAYNDAHHYRAENPLTHLHEDEAPVETDKLKSFH